MSSPKIAPSETTIVGEWRVEHGKTTPNAEVRRIDDLIDGYLIDVATSNDGWSRLFRDPHDGRLWELIYPESSAHGGGAPLLSCISLEEATSRYGL